MGLYRRGKVWWYSITVNGELVRESTKQTSKKKAEDVWVEVVKSVRTGHYIPEDDRVSLPHPFETVVESYLEDRERRGKRTDSYRKLKDWCEVFDGREIRSLTLADVETQLAAWMDARKWSPATYNNALAQVSGVFSFAYKQGWVDRHPLRGRADRMETNNERERYYYPHELAAMERTAIALARLLRQPRRWLADIILGAPFTGLRRGVFCNLRCADVRRDEAQDLWLRVARDKNGKPIEKRLVGQVKGLVEDRIRDALPTAYLFPGPGGGNAYTALGRFLPVVVNRVGKRNPEWDLRWGIKGGGVTFHSFRHAMASLALNSGVPRDVVKRMGNWKTDAMVNRYAHRADHHIRDAEDRLAEVLHISSQSGKGPKPAKVVNC